VTFKFFFFGGGAADAADQGLQVGWFGGGF
jgi:hypothetical protein